MKLLDLFCCAGGAAAGYVAAGFEVVGVDINPQPRYPYEFVQGDALQYLAEHGHEFDAIHASPPCQAYTRLKALHANVHPDLVAPTRELLIASGKPWIMENVVGSPLIDPLVLCGTMFWLGAECRDGEYRQLQRHRLFESNIPLRAPGKCDHQGQAVGVYGNGGSGSNPSARRGYQATKAEATDALGIGWMLMRELSQAIPPAYTEWLGEQLRAHVSP